MHSWSVDEEKLKFKKMHEEVERVTTFLKTRPEIKSIKSTRWKLKENNIIVSPTCVIKIELVKNIHRVDKTNLAFILEEEIKNSHVSVVE